ncbi:MAG TPA: hypothetical protein VFW64_21625 [Pseudonocardiaceae bacterium]|nr:hypothetical protein [Pseudonocardiaceae bacterium]
MDHRDRRGDVRPGASKARTGAALGNPVLATEGRVTLVDGLPAVAVVAGLLLNAGLDWWWADPLAAYVLLAYAAREVYAIFAAEASQLPLVLTSRASNRSLLHRM